MHQHTVFTILEPYILTDSAYCVEHHCILSMLRQSIFGIFRIVFEDSRWLTSHKHAVAARMKVSRLMTSSISLELHNCNRENHNGTHWLKFGDKSLHVTHLLCSWKRFLTLLAFSSNWWRNWGDHASLLREIYSRSFLSRIESNF